MTGLLLGFMIALLVLSAVLTTAGTAVYHVGVSRLRTLQEEGFRGADALARVRAQGRATQGSLRLGVLLLQLLVVAFAGVLGHTWGNLGVTALIVVGSVLVVLVSSEIVPRILAARYPVRLALLGAPFLLVLSRPLRAIATPVTLLEAAVAGTGDADESAEERELREIQELGKEEGVLEEHENLLVERAFRLDEMTAWDIMTPRVDVFAWKDSLTIEDIVEQLSGVPYSRVPVFDGSIDDVTGILYVREAYQAFTEGKRDIPLSSLAREPFFVPGSLSLSMLLRDFQARRTHMGIVADEFGGIDGLVTLEDVLEELVGEIVDETDLDEEDMVRVSRTEAVADAGVDLREINDTFKVSLPILEHRSLNGFILEEMGYVPEVGEVLERAGVRVEVVDATDTQVLRVRITRLPNADVGFEPGRDE